MAVYILGAGASWCTGAYDERLSAPAPFAEDFRPPVMARFFDVARSRFSQVRMRNLESVLKPIGLSVAALERHEAGCANIEHVLSFCDLLERAIAYWAYGGGAPPGLPPTVTKLCDRVRGWPIFGGCPEGTLVRAAEALRSAGRKLRGRPPQSGLSEWERVSFRLGLNSPIRDALDAICEVYGPARPYLPRVGSAAPGPCSNYSAFRRNKLRGRDTVITFNYDFLLDRVLEEEARLKPDKAVGPFPTLFDVAGEPARFLKLHGSVLWWVERNKEQQREYYLGSSYAGNIHCITSSEARGRIGSLKGCGWLPAHRPPDKYVELLIVPPTIAKEEHLARPEISRLWHQAEHDLSLTGSIYVLGYSFPGTDKHVGKMTQAAAKNRPGGSYRGVPVTVVTRPNANQHEVEELESRVRDAFPRADDIAIARDDLGNTIGFAEWVSDKASQVTLGGCLSLLRGSNPPEMQSRRRAVFE